MAKKESSESDSVARARQIAEKAKPNMRVVEVVPHSEESQAQADSVTPDMQDAARKYGFKQESLPKPGKNVHIVRMESKRKVDSHVSPTVSLVVDVDKGEVTGATG